MQAKVVNLRCKNMLVRSEEGVNKEVTKSDRGGGQGAAKKLMSLTYLFFVSYVVLVILQREITKTHPKGYLSL